MVENDPKKQIYLSERFWGPIIEDVQDLGKPAASVFGGGETTIPKAGRSVLSQMHSDEIYNRLNGDLPTKPHRDRCICLWGASRANLLAR